MDPALDQQPGFRRRFRITPEPGRICCEVEDDYHCMSVSLSHDGTCATAVEPVMRRVPWTTCPGAVEELETTFTGVPLAEFVSRGARKTNCTHLHDLAQLAAAHAFDASASVYDILVSDPVDGRRQAEIRLDGRVVFQWLETEHEILEPAELAGRSLWDLHSWIESLDAGQQEAARLLRWGTILASGRIIPLERQSDASRMPANCYTFQPERAAVARRVGEVLDFSEGTARPLDGYEAFN
jgi:hypothetical protein